MAIERTFSIIKPNAVEKNCMGEVITRFEKRGLRVVARMSPDVQWEDALEPHPEWFQRSRDGK